MLIRSGSVGRGMERREVGGTYCFAMDDKRLRSPVPHSNLGGNLGRRYTNHALPMASA